MQEATLKFDNDEKLLKILEEQADSFKHARAKYEIKNFDENKITIYIEAEDSSALRATINSIFITVGIYEKAKKI